MANPSVCCLMLTADRQRFTDRAVCCFRQQTYLGAHLLIYDTGEKPYDYSVKDCPGGGARTVTIVRNPSARGHKIGALRNEAIDMIKADVIVHWDSDDWSDRWRVGRQIGELGIHPATGFHNLLFLDRRTPELFAGAAWEFDYHKFGGYNPRTPHVLGTSLCYWRETWRRTPFSETTRYEDPDWCKRVQVHDANGVGVLGVDNPLLIAEVHGGNMSNSYAVFDKHNSSINPEWRRAPEWDTYARERLYP